MLSLFSCSGVHRLSYECIDFREEFEECEDFMNFIHKKHLVLQKDISAEES